MYNIASFLQTCPWLLELFFQVPCGIVTAFLQWYLWLKKSVWDFMVKVTAELDAISFVTKKAPNLLLKVSLKPVFLMSILSTKLCRVAIVLKPIILERKGRESPIKLDILDWPKTAMCMLKWTKSGLREIIFFSIKMNVNGLSDFQILCKVTLSSIRVTSLEGFSVIMSMWLTLGHLSSSSTRLRAYSDSRPRVGG